MDSETLDRLMLDRGLGALPPDCEVLLVAYLETRTKAAAACREIQQTVDLARRALAEGPAQSLPAFPADRLMRARQSYWVRRVAKGVVGVAASILIGFWTHAMLFPATPSNLHQPGPTLIAQGESPRDSQANREDAGFWSGRRLYEQASGTQRPFSRRVIWDSPVSTPHAGDAI